MGSTVDSRGLFGSPCDALLDLAQPPSDLGQVAVQFAQAGRLEK